mmetsp:Transcript_4764/g.7207  ORF Transcript_4764/g.7207 Transcript_4764/m.7207 type:complete len:244 (-) Transcript_4764:323-1054(-)
MGRLERRLSGIGRIFAATCFGLKHCSCRRNLRHGIGRATFGWRVQALAVNFRLHCPFSTPSGGEQQRLHVVAHSDDPLFPDEPDFIQRQRVVHDGVQNLAVGGAVDNLDRTVVGGNCQQTARAVPVHSIGPTVAKYFPVRINLAKRHVRGKRSRVRISVDFVHCRADYPAPPITAHGGQNLAVRVPREFYDRTFVPLYDAAHIPVRALRAVQVTDWYRFVGAPDCKFGTVGAPLHVSSGSVDP